MPVTGTSNLPIAPRDTKWDAAGARKRIFNLYPTNVAGISRAFLWRSPVADARTPDAYALCYCDVIDGRLMIVPRGLAIAAGGRGVGSLSGVSDEDKATIRARITVVYDRVRKDIPDWPESPFAAKTASIQADADGDAWKGTIAFEGIETGDKRIIRKGALKWEDGPWPLVFDRSDMDHSGMVIGTVNEIIREGNEVRARGNLSDSEDPDTQAAVVRTRELLNEGAVGVSIYTDSDEVADEESEVWEVTAARIRHVAIVDVPAFNRARIALVAAVKAVPEWFANPHFGGGSKDPTQDNGDERLVVQHPERPEEVMQYGAPLTVDDAGRVWGHAALWSRCHLGHPGTCVRPPREPAAYRGFLTGERIRGVPTGPLVFRTTHAPLSATAEAAEAHYAHTGAAVADVTVGSDSYGIWVAGAIRPDSSEQDVEILRASALSGDWRNIGGRLRLVGILAVNAPGFRVARALAADAALITAGPGCDSCDDHASLEERVALLEKLYAESLVSGL